MGEVLYVSKSRIYPGLLQKALHLQRVMSYAFAGLNS